MDRDEELNGGQPLPDLQDFMESLVGALELAFSYIQTGQDDEGLPLFQLQAERFGPLVKLQQVCGEVGQHERFFSTRCGLTGLDQQFTALLERFFQMAQLRFVGGQRQAGHKGGTPGRGRVLHGLSVVGLCLLKIPQGGVETPHINQGAAQQPTVLQGACQLHTLHVVFQRLTIGSGADV